MVTDLTKEHPDKTLWRFLLPMMFSVAFQQIYNIADSMIAGRFAGEDALAAVGASYPITVIFMAFAVGMNLGASVIVSRLFGAGDRKGVKRAVTTAFASSLSLAVILTVYGYFFCRNMMEWIHTPQNIMQDGVLYLKIYVFGLIFLMLYNVCTGIFTALGDSRTPLWFLLGSSAGNIVLDLLFVAKLHWGVAGVAWATFIAQGISAVLALVTLLVRLQKFAGTERVPLFDRKLFVQILAIAVPSILQQSVLSVGNLFVQDIVNRYGSAVVAGYSGAIKLNTFAINIFMTLGSCLSSYTAQNIGAGKQERIPMGFRTGLKLSELTALPFVVLYFGLSQQMMGLFLNAESSAAIHAGVMFLRIVSPWYFMIVVKLMTDGIIRGSGAMIYFVIATIPDLILRIGFALMLSPRFGSTGIWMAWPFGWIAATVLTIIFYRKVKNGYGMRNAAGQK
ncbi:MULTISPECIES: MATE family efflux transporter [Blautia]|jgi:putative MATE family efflux protein|uniref:MATE family efflux transporter n=1 Tax=Blautia TaxID=572511 RepID=UPI000E50EA65|nr:MULTISPECIES: MATE family efflux transporter [Blautia]NSG19250.1 MATE family efflux transporter [Blautia obeum]RGG62779.1 MATE family efflux transporter [Blautia sp. AF19-10LB]